MGGVDGWGWRGRRGWVEKVDDFVDRYIMTTRLAREIAKRV